MLARSFDASPIKKYLYAVVYKLTNWRRWSKGPVLSCPSIQKWMAEAEKMYRDVNLYAKMRRAVMLESISDARSSQPVWD